MKLKIEYLAPYLPYGILFEWKGRKLKCRRMQNIRKYWFLESERDELKEISECKLILRPLCDLLKDNFDYIYDSLNFTDKTNLLLKAEDRVSAVNSFRYYEFQKLLENHFDVFGLIEKGLAISISII